MVRPVPVVRGKKKSDITKKGYDYDLVDLVPGKSVMPTPGMFDCKLGSYK
jgi:hypothetical protein